ncbi:hypothetical protein PPL_02372 [Heterostelium album PN500]|uniref:F-box domain-containing protein n=1 Tax=Heterostelium pallidum (strain ATCC 26659 / Pp 5 / PN500) TaxID=670386 RepID=D3AZJ0_HETP5|nr:hypothetical protein PPL_02372 [Heterostelium album PN500]EFA85369.1 hypothetical protein PPL_02372 [Heterostelium album PN500]|eukprot:XP_020437478.1 hypothetical protein PPL_02372 [Heterostelium album PN500]
MELSQSTARGVLNYNCIANLDSKITTSTSRKKKKQEIFRKITMMANQQQRIDPYFDCGGGGDIQIHLNDSIDSTSSSCSSRSSNSSSSGYYSNKKHHHQNQQSSIGEYFIGAASSGSPSSLHHNHSHHNHHHMHSCNNANGSPQCCSSQKSTPSMIGGKFTMAEEESCEDSDDDDDEPSFVEDDDSYPLDGCVQMDIDSWYSGDPLVSEVLRDIKETIGFMERREMELESVEKTICTLNETREAIQKDIKMKRMFLKQIQKKKEEHIKTITNSYHSLALRYNLSQMESRSLTLILPEEVMLHIFKFLSPMDLCSGVCRVSRKWRALAFDISLWRDICLQRKLLDGSSFYNPSPSSSSSTFSSLTSSSNSHSTDTIMENLQSISNSNNNATTSITNTIDSNANHDQQQQLLLQKYKFNQQSPQTSSHTNPIWGENWYVGEFRKDSNWRRGKYSTTVLRGHKEIVWSLLYESDTNSLISGSEDMTVKVWDCSRIGETHQYYDDLDDSKKRCVKTLGGHKNGTICLGSTPNRLISGSADGSVKIWDRFEGTCVETIQTHSSVWCLQIVNGTLICGCVDGTMRVFDLNTSSCLRTMRGHTAPVRCLQAINHNGQELVVSGSYDKTIKVWDMDARCINTIRAHTHKINCLQYENGQLVSGSHDSLLKVWDMNGQLIHTLQGHDNMIHCLQFKGNKLLSGSTDSTIRLWDLKTGTHVNTIKGQSAVCCLKFNDSKLITGYEDSTIKIFDFSF